MSAAVERPAATLRLPISLAYLVAVISAIGLLALPISVAVAGESWADALTNHELHNMDITAFLGLLILRRQPGHVIGWVLVGVGAFEAVTILGRAYGLLGLSGGATVSGLTNGLWVPAAAGLLIALPQLFPDGRLLSPRWRSLSLFCAVATVLLTALFVADWGDERGDLTNPGFVIGFPLFGVAAVASFVPMAVRFRHASGRQRQQFKWVFYGLAVSVPLIAFGGIQILGGDSAANSALTLIALEIIPIAITVAVLRHRLYDVDVVINKTLVFVVLAGFITAVYAAVVVGIGRLLPIGQGNLGLAIAATALVAVAFEPVRARVQHWANRRVYGRRATPYEALAAMTAQLGDTADPSAALAEAARLLAEGTGAAQAVIWVAQDGLLAPRASAGSGRLATREPVRLRSEGLPQLPGVDLAQAVRHDGELVGALTLTKRAGEGLSTADRRLVEGLAGQAALLLANTRLRSRLNDRLDELRASRQRMLAAQDWARHTLERDLHDGAQQELVALKIKLGLARTIATREGADDLAEQLAATATVADQAVDTLREVARGIYPPLLESEGLAAALTAQTRRTDLAVTVLAHGTARYPREVESTAYFCAVEALANAARHASAEHAHVELDGTEQSLTVTMTDDGAGFDPDATTHGAGLTHMTDRADAAGGTLTVASSAGHGATITLILPSHADADAAAAPAALNPVGSRAVERPP